MWFHVEFMLLVLSFNGVGGVFFSFFIPFLIQPDKVGPRKHNSQKLQRLYRVYNREDKVKWSRVAKS